MLLEAFFFHNDGGAAFARYNDFVMPRINAIVSSFGNVSFQNILD